MTIALGPRIKILLVEDNFYARLGTQTYLENQSELEIVGQVEDGIAGLEAFRRLRPDVVVTDLKMPRFDGAQLTTALAHETPPGRVLLLTHHCGDEDIMRVLRAGALGYLTKEAHGPELLMAIKAVARGERYYPASVASRMAERLLMPSLTPRELQVLAKIFDGLSNREIAEALSITERTAGLFVSKILQKLDARSRTDAVRIALDRGILQQHSRIK